MFIFCIVYEKFEGTKCLIRSRLFEGGQTMQWLTEIEQMDTQWTKTEN